MGKRRWKIVIVADASVAYGLVLASSVQNKENEKSQNAKMGRQKQKIATLAYAQTDCGPVLKCIASVKNQNARMHLFLN